MEIFHLLILKLIANSGLDHALELVNSEINRLDSSMEKAGKSTNKNRKNLNRYSFS